MERFFVKKKKSQRITKTKQNQLLELISSSSKVVGYVVNIQKFISFGSSFAIACEYVIISK